MLTRFAPSPTGELHLGHAYSALLAHDAARATGGRFRIRIDDIDGGRTSDHGGQDQFVPVAVPHGRSTSSRWSAERYAIEFITVHRSVLIVRQSGS